MLNTASTKSAEQIESIEKSVAVILDGAKSLLSDRGQMAESVVAYVCEMQRADEMLARAVELAGEAGLHAEAARLQRRRNSLDGAVTRQVALVANNIGRERDKS